MSSAWQVAESQRRGWLPRMAYWPTGYPPMDTLHAKAAVRDRSADRRRTLLYLPTFDARLAAEPVLGPDWIPTLVRLVPDVALVIKPHPHTKTYQPAWLDSWRQAAAAFPGRVRLEEPGSRLFDLLPGADVILSDVSSAAFFSLPLDRPIIWVTNPRRFEDPKFDAQGLEWNSRQTGQEIHQAPDLPAAVAGALAEPTRQQAARQDLNARLFGETFDGRVAERVEARVRRCLDLVQLRRDYGRGRVLKKRLLGWTEWAGYSLFFRCGGEALTHNRTLIRWLGLPPKPEDHPPCV